jgi:uncharacterized protein
VDAFYRTHRFLVDNVEYRIERQLMSEIDWNQPLIGIKGSRGVGKTTFLLAYAKKYYANDRSCLYINLNNFYFTEHSLVEFADEFSKKGGKVLLIDQVYKDPEWSNNLRQINELFPELKVVFSGSTVMRLQEENPVLYGKVASYNLRGFSFREFINIETNNQFDSFDLDTLLANHRTISREITSKVHPLAYFQDYIHHGYYPFYLEKANYSENLLKTMNMMLEIDITLLKQIELKYLPKLRHLLYLISMDASGTPNVSKLSSAIQTSRATVMNYIKYLKDARLVNLLYPVTEDFPKKPEKIYLHNTNLAFAINRDYSNQHVLNETFLYNMLHKDHKINSGGANSLFVVDKNMHFDIASSVKNVSKKSNSWYAVDMIEKGNENVIPLWLFGFLY